MPGRRHRLCLLLLLVAGPLCADEPAAPPSAAVETPAAAPQAPAAAVNSDKSASEATQKAPAAPAAAPRAPQPASASPQRFNPSERVRADYPVAFPIDI